MAILKTVLLAGDNEDEVLLLQRAFRKAGVRCHLQVVASALEVEKYLKGEGAYADRQRHPRPDLLLIDLGTPRTAGLDLLARLRAESLMAPVTILLSASLGPQEIARGTELGASAVVIKPMRFDDLVESVRKFREASVLVGLG